MAKNQEMSGRRVKPECVSEKEKRSTLRKRVLSFPDRPFGAIALAEAHGGDWRTFEHAVRMAWFEGHETSEGNRSKLANNTKLGMISYGIIDRDASLTEFGRELLAIRKARCIGGRSWRGWR